MNDPWERIAELFAAAAELPPEERTAYLERVCGSDRELLTEVASLLHHHDTPVEFLEQPALGDDFRITAAAPVHDPLIGRQFGAYRIEAQIGAGGVGTVYRGSRHDGMFEHTVAIKIVHPLRVAPAVVKRFRREWQALASLTHANIARLLDAGVSEDGMPYLVLEYIEGSPIDEYCDQRRLTVDERLRLFARVARTVHYAHQRLVVHCDLKPANIMVTDAGVPKLLDFGIARILTPGDGATVTVEPMMTPDYASPEQLRGEPVSTASDVYSLGVLLHELLVGCRPHRYTTLSAGDPEKIPPDREPTRASAVVTGAAGDTTARLRGTTSRRLRRRITGELDTIVLAAMRSDPGRRYSSAEQLAEDVQRHLDGRPIIARPDSLGYRLRKLVARNPLATATAAASLVAVLGGAAATGWQAHVAMAEADHAGVEAMSARRLADVLVEAFLVSGAGRAAADRDAVRSLLARQLERARREMAREHHARANLVDALGRVYGRLGMYDEAGRCIDEAREIRVREFGEHSLETALSAGSAGELALHRGDLPAARSSFELALQLHRELPHGVHTDVATAANDLAVTLRLLGDLDGAAALHEEALELRRQQNGPRHTAVAVSLNNLAAIDVDRRRFDVAERRLREVLAIRTETLGKEDPLVAQTLNNLAIVVFQAGRREEGESLLRQAVELYRSTPGTDPDALARSLFNLADSMRMRKDLTGARPCAEEALGMLRRLHEGPHPDTAKALTVLATIESLAGDHVAAIGHHAEALAAVRVLFPAGHPRIGSTLCSYGSALIDGGRADEAEEVFREATALLRATDPPSQLLLGTALYGLGVAAARRGRRAPAEQALREAQQLLAGCGSDRAAEAARQLSLLGKPR